jgi:hypothetical protein
VRQPQKNLFFSYRGGFLGDNHSDLVLDKQLEDNATKALVYVLEHANRASVLRPFLRDLVGLKTTLNLEEIEFALQRADIARSSVEHRIAMCIAPVAHLKRGIVGTHNAGRPDAWIWREDSFAILIETKVRGMATEDQLLRHIRGAQGWTSANTQRRCVSWSQVYDFFVKTRRQQPNADRMTRLLLDEFVGYLRMTALASGTTFDLDDFGYFLLQPKDRDQTTRALLKRKLVRFTEEFSASAAVKEIVRHYGGRSSRAGEFVSPGVFRKDSPNYWITVGPKQRRNRCHFTVRLSEEGISLEAFSPHKSFTKRFVRKIAEQPEGFIASLSAIDPRAPYTIRLREAYYHNPESSYKGQRISNKVDYLEIHPRVLTEVNLSTLIVEPIRMRLTNPTLRPEMFLIRHFQLSELVGNSKVVELVATAARSMLGYLRFALEL